MQAHALMHPPCTLHAPPMHAHVHPSCMPMHLHPYKTYLCASLAADVRYARRVAETALVRVVHEG